MTIAASPQQRTGSFEAPTRVLVTGASGFVGACAARRLVQDGHHVCLLLRRQARLWRLREILSHPSIAVATADLAEPDATRRAVEAARAEVVLHLATEGAYEHQADPHRILTTNVGGTINLLQAATTAGVQLFINAGSSSEYGYQPHPMRESERLAPNSYYAVAKAAQTHLVSLAGQTQSLATVTFRLFSAYGPWEEPTRLVPTLIRRARAGLPLILTAPDIARDFVYVDDILEALLAFSKLRSMRGEVLNLGTGVQSSLREVVSAVLAELGSSAEVRWSEMAPRRWDTTSWRADPSLACRTLGWRPRVTLVEGIRKMAQWMHEVGDDYGAAQEH